MKRKQKYWIRILIWWPVEYSTYRAAQKRGWPEVKYTVVKT